MQRVVAICAAVTLLAGCAASGTQVSEQAAFRFKEGVTTEAEIVQRLGPPTSVHVGQGLRWISYAGTQYQLKPASFIPIVGAFAGGADVQVSVATYEIDQAGRLVKIVYSGSSTGTRSGTTPAAATSKEPAAVQ
jgi:hypothetical protein